MSDKVVHLEFRTKDADTEGVEYLACKLCRNKSWTATYEGDSGFPLLKCGACGQHAGRFGWVDE